MGGVAGEALAQLRILRGDADGTGVQVADAHHNAAHGDQRRGGKAKLFSAQHGGNHHIATCLQLPIRLNDNTTPQVIEHERLVGFCQPKLPRQSRMLDAGLRRGPRATIMPTDQNDIRMAFGDTRSDGPYAYFRHQFDTDARMVIGIFQIVDELRQILDGVDVMVRWRRNQPYPGGERRTWRSRDRPYGPEVRRLHRVWRPAPS